MKKTLYTVTTTLLSTAAALVMMAACSSEEILPDISGQGETFTVTAEVAQQLYSRAYQEEGQVKEGIYYLSYLQNTTNDLYNVAWVDFAKEGTAPGIGIVTVPDNQELTWDNVDGTTPTFYLDNVLSNLVAGSNSTTVKLPQDGSNPYKAALFDDKEGTNDLLWGSVQVSRGVKNVNFQLHHNMSRVRVEITVDKTHASENEVNLEGATVQITSINQVPESFNRRDGSLGLTKDSKGYTPLTLVSDDIPWKKTLESEENSKIETWITHDFVLPPQDLLTDDNRPRLVITLANGTSYKGILPTAMEINSQGQENSEAPSYPVALSFLKEHILTIRTIITQKPPELSFMPVWVVQWVDKGNFNLEAHQAGIYTAEEFYKLIDYYKNNNEYQLNRYGKFDTTKNMWIFDFFNSVTLEKKKIAGEMKNGENFSFNFHNYTHYITEKDGTTELKDPVELYKIVTGT